MKPINIQKITSENQKLSVPMNQSSTKERSEILLGNTKDQVNESFGPAIMNSSASTFNFSFDSTLGSEKKIPQTRQKHLISCCNEKAVQILNSKEDFNVLPTVNIDSN